MGFDLRPFPAAILELILDSKLLAFRHDTPKLELRSDLAFALNLTTDDRYRGNYDGRLSLELVKNLFWDIDQIYYHYDSDPSDQAAPKDDYGVVTGLRYKL